MTTISNMNLHNCFCNSFVLCKQVFLETKPYEFLLNVSFRSFGAICRKVHLNDINNEDTSQIYTSKNVMMSPYV